MKVLNRRVERKLKASVSSYNKYRKVYKWKYTPAPQPQHPAQETNCKPLTQESHRKPLAQETHRKPKAQETQAKQSPSCSHVIVIETQII